MCVCINHYESMAMGPEVMAGSRLVAGWGSRRRRRSPGILPASWAAPPWRNHVESGDLLWDI